MFEICASFCQILWFTNVKKRGKCDVLYLCCHPPGVPKCRVFCWQVVYARFYHNPFIISVAGNSVLHHYYVVFNPFCCSHTHFSPYLIYTNCNISVTNLYKLIVSEMESVCYSTHFLLLQSIREKKRGEENNFNVIKARYQSLGGMDCLSSMLTGTVLWGNQIVNQTVKWFIFPNSL